MKNPVLFSLDKFKNQKIKMNGKSSYQLILISENVIGLAFKTSLKLLNQYGQAIKKINFDSDITRNYFNEACLFFVVKNSIFQYEISSLCHEPVEKYSFDEKVQAFGYNKRALVVVLQNSDCLFTDIERNIHSLFLFNNLSILCFVFESENKFIAFLSLENGYEMIDLKTFEKKIIFRFSVTENFITFFKTVIKIHNKMLIVLLVNEALVFDNRSMKIINKFTCDIDVSNEILNYVNVLMNGHFIILSSNKGKIFVFNFIDNRLFIKFDFKVFFSITSNDETIFYLDETLNLKILHLSLITKMDDYDYYDEKMLYLLNLFEKEREIKLENEKRETTRNFFFSFTRKTNKFISKIS
jgi:hypothetical protein